MTAFDRFDQLDRRITDALEEIAMPQVPDYLDDVFRRTARTSQRSTALHLRRFQPMNRISLAAAAAVMVAILAGGALILSRSTAPSVGAPSPSASVAPSPTPAPSKEPTVAAPALIWGDWVADPGPLGLPDQGNRIQLSINWDKGLDAWVQTNYQTGTQVFNSDSVAAPDGQIRLVSQNTTDGCAAGDVGTYGWSRSTDGLFLTLTTVSDDCAARAATLARTWVHTLSAVTDGGHGVLPAMNIEMTVPSRRFGLGGANFAGDLTTFDSSPFLGLLLFQDPTGFKDPCSATNKNALGANATRAAVVAYLRGLPGYTFKTVNVTIDGRSAIHVTGTPKPGFTCAAGEVGLFWSTGTSEWTSPPASPLSFWVTDVDSHAWLFWYRGDSLTPADEAQVISTIHFITTLPTP